MAQNRYYSSLTHRTITTADPGALGTTLTVADTTSFAPLDGSFPYTLLINWSQGDQEVVNVTARPSGTTFTIVRGQDGTTGVAHPIGATVDHGVSARDFNEAGAHIGAAAGVHGVTGAVVGTTDTQTLSNKTLTQPVIGDFTNAQHVHTGATGGGALGIAPGVPIPGYWRLFGHSYFAQEVGTVWTTGRCDAFFRELADIEWTNWQNYAVLGANLTIQGVWTGGWARVMQNITHDPPAGQNLHGSPYFADGGGTIFCFGINDIGGVNATQAQIQTSFQHTLRACISRARSSVVYEDNSTVGGLPTYGAGFTLTSNSQDYSSGTSVHTATTTTNATVTITLPSDYNGEPVAIQFSCMPGAQGGTVTFSGTAGVTGTLALTGVAPATPNSHIPVVKRLTNLTSANAGQTIIATVTQIDASGQVLFDCWWLESLTPAPVIVCNVPRILSNGYAGYSNVIGDTDVANLNTVITNVVAEFDGMVQIADLDSALNKNTNRFAADGLHPNELGAGYCAQALLNAVSKLVPTIASAPAISVAQSSPQAGPLRIPRISGNYYGVATTTGATATGPASGTMYAMPFVVSEAREMYNRYAFRVNAAGTTAGSIRVALYDDPRWQGYPQNLVNEPTVGGALSTGTTAGMVQSPAGQFTWALDPGLWWLVWKQITAGTSQAFDFLAGPDLTCIMPHLTTASLLTTGTAIAWTLTGQGTGGFPGDFPSGAAVATSCPKFAILKM